MDRLTPRSWLAARTGLLALTVLACTGCAGLMSGKSKTPEEPPLVGVVERSEIESFNVAWATALAESTVEDAIASELGSAGEGTELTVYFGTWCGDSRREVSRFFRALDTVAGEVPFNIEYIGVGREKATPVDLLEGVGLLYVPTFVVKVDGEEVGRIVEESPNSIESDLLALLEGDQVGLITTKTELLEPDADGSIDEHR